MYTLKTLKAYNYQKKHLYNALFVILNLVGFLSAGYLLVKMLLLSESFSVDEFSFKDNIMSLVLSIIVITVFGLSYMVVPKMFFKNESDARQQKYESNLEGGQLLNDYYNELLFDLNKFYDQNNTVFKNLMENLVNIFDNTEDINNANGELDCSACDVGGGDKKKTLSIGAIVGIVKAIIFIIIIVVISLS